MAPAGCGHHRSSTSPVFTVLFRFSAHVYSPHYTREDGVVSQSMDALLAREQAAGEAAAAGQRRAAGAAPASAGKKKKDGTSAAKSSAARVQDDGYSRFGMDIPDDSPDEADSDLEANGYAIPELLKDPQTAADIEASVGRRVFLDSSGYVGSIIGWRAKGKVWEVELDRNDERVTVRSSELRSLEVKPAPARKKSAEKKKSTDRDTSAGIKKKKKKPKNKSSE